MLVRPGFPAPAPCQGGAHLQSVTLYQFDPTPLLLNVNLPLGTVIAATEVSPAPLGTPCGRARQEWRQWPVPVGLFDTVQTNLSGVGVRVIVDSPPDNGQDGGLQTLDVDDSDRAGIAGGDFRIELVKTGFIQPGVLSQVLGELQYATTRGGQRITQSLVYHGRLVVAVSLGGRQMKPTDRLSWRVPPVEGKGIALHRHRARQASASS
ncbi:hypothetical protein [Serratia fonticola]|uniref:hypothetical protein n=1 Tax=Serratia fonticola TaxID=47917 RepID=UPI00301CC00C